MNDNGIYARLWGKKNGCTFAVTLSEYIEKLLLHKRIESAGRLIKYTEFWIVLKCAYNRQGLVLLCTFLYSADYDKKILGSDSMMIFV